MSNRKFYWCCLIMSCMNSLTSLVILKRSWSNSGGNYYWGKRTRARLALALGVVTSSKNECRGSRSLSHAQSGIPRTGIHCSRAHARQLSSAAHVHASI